MSQTPSLIGQAANIGNRFIQGVSSGREVAQSRIQGLLQQRQIESSQNQDDFRRLKVFIETEGKILDRFIEQGDEQGAKDYLEKRKGSADIGGVLQRTGMSNVGVFAFTDSSGKQKRGIEVPFKITAKNIGKFPEGSNVQIGDTGIAKMSQDASKIFSFKRDDDPFGTGGKVGEERRLKFASAKLKIGLRELDARKKIASDPNVPAVDRDTAFKELKIRSEQMIQEFKKDIFVSGDIEIKDSPTKLSPEEKKSAMDSLVDFPKKFNTLEDAVTSLESQRSTFEASGMDTDKMIQIATDAFELDDVINAPAPSDQIAENLGQQVQSPNIGQSDITPSGNGGAGLGGTPDTVTDNEGNVLPIVFKKGKQFVRLPNNRLISMDEFNRLNNRTEQIPAGVIQ